MSFTEVMTIGMLKPSGRNRTQDFQRLITYVFVILHIQASYQLFIGKIDNNFYSESGLFIYIYINITIK